MPFNPFTSVTGRNALTLFDIRLDNDFIVFRGNDHEASGQLVKGVLVICVPSPIKIEDIHLRLTGTQRLSWTDPKLTPSGLTSTKIDRSNVILNHQWAPFWGTPGKSAILEKGNYEFPFELMLPGDTCESVEGLHEASVIYKLKATIARGKLAYDLHAYKHLRIVRTLESSALEFLHAMSVENIWPNKVEYSIVVPQKAVVFGSHIPLESRFTPLLKGLELGDITVKLIEIHEFIAAPLASSSSFSLMREFRNERMVQSWNIGVSREDHWQEMIEDTGQEGWVINWSLDLPRKLGRCIQDVNVHGIKVRHKLKMVVALKNPDGHVSELRATLPLTIFISPNIPLDEQGNLTAPSGPSSSSNTNGLTTIAPPGYGEHILDQLYDDVEIHNLQTPAPMSAVHSPIYGLSRAGSSENLASMNAASIPVHPAALTSRLQDVSAREMAIRRNFSSSGLSHLSSSADAPTPFTPIHLPHSFMHRSASTDVVSNATAGESHSHPQSEAPSRRNSGESRRSEGNTSDHSGETGENNEEPEVDMQELCKVPSYATAIKSSRIGPIRGGDDFQLPDYRTAASRPNVSRTSSTSSLTHIPASVASGGALTHEPLSLIAEAPQEHVAADEDGLTLATTSRQSSHGTGSTSESSDASANQRTQRMHHRSRTAGYQPDTSSASDDSNTTNTTNSTNITNASSSGSGSNRWRPLSRSVSLLHSRHSPSSNGDTDEHAWLRLSQARDHVAT